MTQWQPPVGPERPEYVPESNGSTPRGDRGTRYLLGGIVGVLVGVGAIVLQDAYKLDANAILSGGVYLKSGYRHALLFAGIALVVLGLALTMLGAINDASASARTTLFAITLTLVAVTLAGGGIVVAGVVQKRQDLQSTQESLSPDQTTYQDQAPTRAADGNGSPLSCGSGGCFQDGDAVYPVDDGDSCSVNGIDGRWSGNDMGNEFVCLMGTP